MTVFGGLQCIGFFKDEQDIIDSPEQRLGGTIRPGDLKYVDQNNDGRIDSKDYVSLGSATPDYFGGFYTNIRYKQFALAAEFS